MIDIGANLTDKSFNKDLPLVLDRARASGVEHIVVTATDLEDSRHANELARNSNGYLYATAGVHPHNADQVAEGWLKELKPLVESAVAVGETGLDYFRNFSSRSAQRQIFEAQLRLALELDKPVFIHDRDSEGELLEILQALKGLRGVIHCFTGTEELLLQYLKLGFCIGITGWICDERRGVPLRDAVTHIPDDRLLIETDAPYLLPRTIKPRPRSRRNEPANLRYVAEMTARARGQDIEHVLRITTENSRRLFCLQ